MKEVNYWKKSKDDLIALYHERELPGDPSEMSRKAQIEAIKQWDKEHPEKAEALQSMYVPTHMDSSDPLTGASEMERVKLAPDGKPLRKFTEPMMLIVFHYRNEDEPDYVPLGVNGRCISVPKDTEVLIPEVFMSAIKDAVEIKYVKRVDPMTGKPKMVRTQVPRFAYHVLQTGIK